VRTNRYGLEVRFLGIKKLGLPASVTQLVLTDATERFLRRAKFAMKNAPTEEIRSRATLESRQAAGYADQRSHAHPGAGQRRKAKSSKSLSKNGVWRTCCKSSRAWSRCSRNDHTAVWT